MKTRSLIFAALLVLILLAGCTMHLSKATPTTQPTAQLTPPVPEVAPTGGAVMTLTSENEQALPIVNSASTQQATPTATTPPETAKPTAVPTAKPTAQPTAQPTAVPTAVSPAQPAATVVVRVGDDNYPASPEEVVKAFLNDYINSSGELTDYMSSTLVASLPAGGAAEAAQLSGTLQSYVIQSGSASQDPPIAVVQVSLRLNGVETVRIFRLTLENEQWRIEMIDIARG